MSMTLRAPVQQLAGRREWIALAVLALPLLLVSMDVSVLYFAVPFISADLHAHRDPAALDLRHLRLRAGRAAHHHGRARATGSAAAGCC